VHVGVVLTDVVGDGALAHGGRTGEHDESGIGGTVPHGGAFGQEVAQPVTLVRAEAAEAFRRGDFEAMHDALHLGDADRRDADEQLGDPQPAFHTGRVRERGGQHVQRGTFSGGDLRLHGGAGTPGGDGGA